MDPYMDLILATRTRASFCEVDCATWVKCRRGSSKGQIIRFRRNLDIAITGTFLRKNRRPSSGHFTNTIGTYRFMKTSRHHAEMMRIRENSDRKFEGVWVRACRRYSQIPDIPDDGSINTQGLFQTDGCGFDRVEKIQFMGRSDTSYEGAMAYSLLACAF